jgi:hypothetical protein
VAALKNARMQALALGKQNGELLERIRALQTDCMS